MRSVVKVFGLPEFVLLSPADVVRTTIFFYITDCYRRTIISDKWHMKYTHTKTTNLYIRFALILIWGGYTLCLVVKFVDSDLDWRMKILFQMWNSKPQVKQIRHGTQKFLQIIHCWYCSGGSWKACVLQTYQWNNNQTKAFQSRPEIYALVPNVTHVYDVKRDAQNAECPIYIDIYIYIYIYIYVCVWHSAYTGVPGGMCQTSGECSLC